MSQITRKKWALDILQVRLKPDSLTTEITQNLEILEFGSIMVILSTLQQLRC